MKIDMAGGAAVLGFFSCLSDLPQVGVDIYGILPACENMPSGHATRPGDIVTALNGKTIEVLNTDAEGRMALADAISYAEKNIRPDYIIDLATLTGAIMVALGENIAGLFSNNTTLAEKLIKAAKTANEKVWEMPLPEEYKDKMKSDIADLRNISSSSYGGAITAAIFLQEFVSKAKWAHLDIAATAFNEGKETGLIPKGGTGFGVKSLVEYLLQEFT